MEAASREPGAPRSLRRLAEATPPTRDRYVDFLRALSIAVVVLGHWLIAAIYWGGGRISGVNALQVIPGLWLATWILQVMPLFFFVGGFSNLVSLDAVERRGGGYAEFVSSRVARLMRPTTMFLAVWVPLAVAADLLTPLGNRVLDQATTLLTRPLWFIGIYLIVIAFAPAMVRLHRRHGLRVVAALAAGAVAVDLLSVGLGLPFVGYLNFAFVWLLVHQCGFLYADGTLPRLPRPVLAIMAAGGLAVLLVLTAPGPYSASMVGLLRERSNTNPPTVAIIALTVWQIGIAMLLRERLTRWLSRIRVWMGVIWVSAVIMTVFLWHQTAMLLAVGVLYPLGFPQPEVGTAAWWAVRPLWVLSLLAALVPLLLIFGRFERGRRAAAASPQPPSEARGRSLATVVGATYVILGILGFAVTGMDAFAHVRGQLLVFFEVNPLQNLIHLVIGWLVLRSVSHRRVPRREAAPALLLLALLGGAGLVLDGPLDIIASNLPDNVLHLASAALLAWALGRSRQPAAAR